MLGEAALKGWQIGRRVDESSCQTISLDIRICLLVLGVRLKSWTKETALDRE